MRSGPATADRSGQEPASGGTFVMHEKVKHLLLTSFKPDGTPVTTAVRVVIDGDRARFRLRTGSGTAKRLRRSDWVQVARCSALGFVRYGPLVNATARPLDGAHGARAADRPGRGYPAWRLARWVSGWEPVWYELRPDEGTAG